MADKLMIYEVEDLETNQIYEIEGPEGLDENTLNDFVASQRSATPQPQAQDVAQAAPAAPQVVQTTRPLPRVGMTGQTAQAGPDGVITPVQADTPVTPKWATPEEEAMIAEAIANPNLGDDEVNALIGDLSAAKGMPRMSMAPGQSEQRQQYIQYLQENQKAPAFGGYTDWKNTLPTPGDTLSENDGFFSQIIRSIQEGSQQMGLGVAARTINDLWDTGSEIIDLEFPDATPEQKEALRDEYLAWLQKGVRAANAEGIKNDGIVPWLIGQVVTPDPVDIVPFGKAAKAVSTAGKIAEKAVEGGVVNLTADSIYQALDIYDGVQEKFNPLQSAAAVGFGAALHGGVEGAAAGVKRIQSGELPDPVEVKKDTYVVAPTTTDKRTKLYKQQMAEATDQVLVKIGTLTEGWTNAPEFVVQSSFKGLPDVPKDAVGFLAPDGKVYVNTENVLKQAKRAKASPDDVVSALTFHEALGHYGLAQKFGDELDNVLLRLYDEGADGLKARVDEWLTANPKAYEGDPKRVERGIEEILAEDSGAGRIKASVLDRMTNMLKGFARQVGLDLKFSGREVRTILGMAHNAVVSGKARDVSANDYKFMRLKREPSEELEADVARKVLDSALEDYEPTYSGWAEARRAAKDRGLTAKQINSSNKRGFEDLDKKLFQYDKVMQATNDKLVTLTIKMEQGDFTMKDKEEYIRTALVYKELSAKIFDDQAEIGRALSAMRALDFTKKRVMTINEALADLPGNNLSGLADERVFEDFASQVKTMLVSGNQKAVNNLLTSIVKPYWWQYILSFRHSMMLSGMGTHAKNATDNALMIARELEEQAISLPGYFLRKGINKAGGSVLEGTSPQEVAGRMYGLLRALGDAGTYKSTAEAFRTGHGNHPISSKIEMQDARIPGISKVGDALFAADVFFRAFHNNANLYTLGVRKARQKGFTGMSAFEEGANIAHNPTPELLAEAEKMTDVALLVDSPSALTDWLEPGKSVRPGMNGGQQFRSFMINLMLPFLRVTDRLLFQKLRRSPLSFLDKVTREDIAAGGARMDIALARTMYGSALIAYYWNMAGEGEVEGAAPLDYDKVKSMEGTGYLPNSIEEEGKMVDASALNLSLNPLDLQNSVATNIATIRKAWEKGEDVSEQLGLAFLALGSVISSSSFAENVTTYTEPFKDGGLGDPTTATANLFGSVASQFIPAAMRQYNSMVADPFKRDATGDKSVGDRVYGRIASAVPGLSDDLPQRYDVLGDPVIQGKSLLGMDNYQPIKNDEVSKEIRRLEKGTDKAVIDGAPSTVTYEGSSFKLDAELKQEWQRIQGEFMKMGMGDMIKTPEYRASNDEEKRELIKEMKTEAYDATKEMLLPYIVGVPE